MRCLYPQQRWFDGNLVKYPCGRCEACLRNRRNEKALRGYLESLSHDNSVFLTLTYSDELLPLNRQGVPTLYRLDFDSFLKRIRGYYDTDIRFLGCGEYSSIGRPHYHLCLFGLCVDDFIRRTAHYRKNSSGYILEDYQAWPYGGCQISPFDIKTSFYISKYLIKSSKSKADYEALDIEPEFISQSRRPALGKRYCLEHRERLLKDGFIRCKGVKFPIPRYFLNRVLNNGSDDYQDLKERLSIKANEFYGKYIKDLNRQFNGSNKHIYEQISEEALAREKTLMKGK